jgi:hypothetical protein
MGRQRRQDEQKPRSKPHTRQKARTRRKSSPIAKAARINASLDAAAEPPEKPEGEIT